MSNNSNYSVDLDLLSAKLKTIRRDLRDEYTQDHNWPWIVGFSGGKDSTLLAHLTIESILSLPKEERRRPVFLVSNDTLVESPIFKTFVDNILARIDENIEALRVPVTVVKTQPLAEESFWVNLLGKGYPAPNRSFRWCTDRMKVRPTSRFIRQQVANHGEAILLLGVRRSESSARSATISRHEANTTGRLSPHSDQKGVWIFSPIKELTTDEVWTTILSCRPPWGGTYRDLVTLYKNAQGGECPFVMSDSDAPSCGSNSARFGCWTCTVVEKDGSLENLIAAGHDHLEPLADYRRRLKSVSEDPNCRSKTRRNGQSGLGPILLPVRQQLLDELLTIQSTIGIELISDLEVRLIRDQWGKDQADETWRDLCKYLDSSNC
jgi:DNA sulfur modification protein DndC